jgi:glycosyltransferase involved in cell wall biosynthesis
MPLISISDSQREPMVPGVNWVSTIYHGLPPDVATFNPKGGDYLAFLGRISPEKRPDRAIEIARRAGKKLKIAAKIDKADQEYFDEEIKHLFAQPHVEYIGEVDERQKIDFLGNAAALLFPIDWREPFGLVMIEAMSSGTPVVAWRNGSVPEVIEHGVGGVIVESMDEAVAGVDQVLGFDRAKVRAYFESRFTAEKMASGYIDAYNKVIDSGARGPRLVAAE